MMQQKSKAVTHLTIQVVGLGYVAYIIFQLVTSYMRGEWDISSGLFAFIIAAMTTAEVVLAVFSIRAWRRDRKKEREEEAKAKEMEQQQDGASE